MAFCSIWKTKPGHIQGKKQQQQKGSMIYNRRFLTIPSEMHVETNPLLTTLQGRQIMHTNDDHTTTAYIRESARVIYLVISTIK